jgi:hypothetical protein
MQKKKKRVPNSGYPYPTRISGYLPGSIGSVSDPNSNLHYPGITRIRLEYKNTCIRIRKKRVFALSVSSTRQVYLTRFHPYQWIQHHPTRSVLAFHIMVIKKSLKRRFSVV